MLVFKSENEHYYSTAEAGKGWVSHLTKGEYFTKVQSLNVRDLGDDVISITLHQYHTDNETQALAEDFVGDDLSNLFVTREHALEFANAIIEALKG